MSAARYHPDHTAHIRQRLKNMAVCGVAGLVFAAAAAGVIALIGTGASGASAVLERVVWIVDATLGGVAVITLVVTAVLWMVYRRRRAELDAQGAEIIGEWKARIARRRPDQR
jgi:hypothetical protein